jgi:hypothetical protein
MGNWSESAIHQSKSFMSDKMPAKSIFTEAFKKRIFSLSLFKPSEQITLQAVITKVVQGCVFLTIKNHIREVLHNITKQPVSVMGNER